MNRRPGLAPRPRPCREGARMGARWLLAGALAMGARPAPAAAGGAGAHRSGLGEAWVQVVARGALSSPEEGAITGAGGEGDATVRCQAAGLTLGARATDASGARARLRALSARWSRSPDTELLVGSLRVHLGAGCLVGDEDWDELKSAQSFTPRMLRAATTLSLSSRARPGALARAAVAGVRLAAWGAGATCDGDGACALASHLGHARLEGVAIGTRSLLLAAVRTAGGPSPRWAWSASASRESGSASTLIELAGPLSGCGRPRSRAWEPALVGWRNAVVRRVTAIGGRWRIDARPLLGELEGAFRWHVSLSPEPGPGEASRSAPATRGWRLGWSLPGLAGVQPTLVLLCRCPEDVGEPALLEREVGLDLGARPWSGLWLRAGLDTQAGGRLRAADRTGAASQIVRTTAGGFDLEARLQLDERLTCVLRYRQRDASQSLDAAAQPRQREILEEAESPASGAEQPESYAEPIWLRERTGSAFWFRATWRGAGRGRAGLGLAATPRTSSLAALVPTRLPPGGAGWRPLGAGAQLAEAWFGLDDRAWGLEVAARWCNPAGGQPLEVAVVLGAAWRARLAGPADRH